MGNCKARVLVTNMLFPVSLCLQLRASESLLQCPIDVFMSQGWALAWPMDSPPQCFMRLDNRERQRLWENTSWTTVSLDWTRWCNDQQTGENVKVTLRACVDCVWQYAWVGACVCVGYQCIHYPLLQTCISHIFKIPLKTSCFLCFYFEGYICASVL